TVPANPGATSGARAVCGAPMSTSRRRPHSAGQLAGKGLRILRVEARGLHAGCTLLLLGRRDDQPEGLMGRIVEDLSEHQGSHEDAAVQGHGDGALTDADAPEPLEKK